MGARWGRTNRVALFDYRATPTVKEKAAKRDELARALDEAKPRTVYVLPTADVGDDGQTQQASTTCWHVFRAPDSLDAMRGCWYEWSAGSHVVPLWPHSPHLKQLQYWQQAEWLRREYRPPLIDELLITPSPRVVEVLAGWADTGAPLAVDIESIEATGIITAIGLADGRRAVSIPYERYRPYGCAEDERGLDEYPEGEAILSILKRLLEFSFKIFHNHTFDVPRLKAKGFCVDGTIHDTFCAHAIAYPELRHGLQAACAGLLSVPPWKSMWHPKLKGITRDDIEYWICDPVALRDYNAKDAHYTWHLASVVLPQVEQRWPC